MTHHKLRTDFLPKQPREKEIKQIKHLYTKLMTNQDTVSLHCFIF